MKVKNFKKSFFSKTTFFSFFLFLSTLLLGIFVSHRIFLLSETIDQEIDKVSLIDFTESFAFALLFLAIIFLLSKKSEKTKKVLMKTLFLMTTGLGSLISFSTFLGDFSVIVVLLIVFFWLKSPSVFLQNLLVVTGIAGAGSIIGLKMEPYTVISVLVLFSIYDYIAVYKTKHMVKMAKGMIEGGAIVGIVIPRKMLDFQAPIKDIKPGGERFFVLGGGDLTFPLILCCSVLPWGIAYSLITVLFSLVGFFFTLFIFSNQKERKAVPALPPIALFSILGFLVALIIW